MKHLTQISVAALLAALSAGASAHGGEDHSAQASPVITAANSMAPRAQAQTEDFELLLVLQDRKLIVNLDRYASNEPVREAQIEIESGKLLKAQALASAPGVYVLELPAGVFAKPGKYPLTISVQAGEVADLLTATLDLSAPATGVQHRHARSEWAIWGGSAVLLLAGAGLLALHRRKRHAIKHGGQSR